MAIFKKEAKKPAKKTVAKKPVKEVKVEEAPVVSHETPEVLNFNPGNHAF